MTARTELEIVWDGPVKGLADHRVSLTMFGQALDLLMKAARRIASQKLTDALEPADTGRLASSAKNLDIEITAVKQGSGGFATFLTFEIPDSSQALLFNQLPESVGIELLDAIHSEANGTHRNSAVRNYLKALPKELTRQTYRLHENGRPIRNVEVSKLQLPEQQSPLPAFVLAEGRVAGVGFDPGRCEVRIKGEDGFQLSAAATARQVDQALGLRSQNVHVVAVTTAAGARLLTIETDTMRVKRPSLDDLFDQWEETYRALA